MDGRWLLGIALMGCAPAPSTPAAAPAPEPAPARARADAVTSDQPPPPHDPLAGLDADEKWKWAVAQLPALAELTLVATAPIEFPVADGETITLHSPDLHRHSLDSFPYRPCTPLKFLKDAQGLRTRVPLRGGPGRPDLNDDYADVILGSVLEVGATFSDGLHGGVATALPPPRLTEVNADRLRYHGRPAGFAVVCANSEHTRHCRDGTTSTCQTCTPVLREVPDYGDTFGGHAVTKDSPCEPCPPEGDDLVAILGGIVREREFVTIDELFGPSFFRTVSDCKAAAKRRPKSG